MKKEEEHNLHIVAYIHRTPLEAHVRNWRHVACVASRKSNERAGGTLFSLGTPLVPFGWCICVSYLFKYNLN